MVTLKEVPSHWFCQQNISLFMNKVPIMFQAKETVPIEPEDDVERAREFNFPPDLPDFVKSINSLSGSSNFRSKSISNDWDDKRCTPEDPPLSLENDESKLIRQRSFDVSTFDAFFDESTFDEPGGGFFAVSIMTSGGNSALDSFQQHLATMMLIFRVHNKFSWIRFSRKQLKMATGSEGFSHFLTFLRHTRCMLSQLHGNRTGYGTDTEYDFKFVYVFIFTARARSCFNF